MSYLLITCSIIFLNVILEYYLTVYIVKCYYNLNMLFHFSIENFVPFIFIFFCKCINISDLCYAIHFKHVFYFIMNMKIIPFLFYFIILSLCTCKLCFIYFISFFKNYFKEFGIIYLKYFFWF